MATLSKSKKKKDKKKRLIAFSLMFLIQLIISPVLMYVIHQFLLLFKTGESISDIEFNYLNALKVLMHPPENYLTLYGCLEVLILCFLVFTFSSIRSQISDVETKEITPDIVVPIPAGNGQHGNERFLTENEKGEIFSTFEFTGKEELKEKGGVVVQMIKKKGKEIILYCKKDIHSLILGATRAGKTRRMLLETICMQILSGISFVASDVKGELFYYTSGFAKEKGYKVIALDLINPEKSSHYNFLQPIIDAIDSGDISKGVDYTWDLVSVLVGKQKGEPLWYNGETATIAAAILIVCLDAPAEFRNLTNVYYFLANMCESDMFGRMPISSYLEKLPDTHPAKAVFAMATIASEKTRSSFYTSALGTLRLFTKPSIAEMTSKSDFSLKDIGLEKTAVYMLVRDDVQTLYPLVSVFMTQLYSLQVETASEHGLRLPVPTDYNLDELGNFPTIPVLGNIVSAGASRGVRANLIVQDYQQLESKYKDNHKNIRTNCQLKIYLKSDDPDTLKSISDGLGKYTVEVSSASTSLSDGKNQNTNFSNSSSLTGRSLLEQSELKRIKAPYSLCMMTGEYAGINLLPDLSEYKFNELLGLGDEKHNTNLIMERMQQRESREIPEINLWGIWKKYKSQETDEMEEEVEENSKLEKEKRVSFLF